MESLADEESFDAPSSLVVPDSCDENQSMDPAPAGKGEVDLFNEQSMVPESDPAAAMDVDEPEHGDAQVFTTMLGLLGVRLPSDSKSSVIVDDPAVFKAQLQRKLMAHEQELQEFIVGLERFIEDDQRFRRLLARSMAPRGSQVNKRPPLGLGDKPRPNGDALPQQDGLIRLLLGVDAIQDAVIELLLQKLLESMNDASEQRTALRSRHDDIPSQILSQLRWLDAVRSPAALTQRLLDMMSLCPVTIQRDIVAALPEICDESSHELVVQALQRTMSENGEIAVAFLDALANMSSGMSDDMTASVTTSVLDTLNSARVEDLPVIVRFLLQTATKDNIATIVRSLRASLDSAGLVGLSKPAGSSSSKDAVKTSGLPLVIDAIRTGIRYHNMVGSAFIKEIQSITEEARHRVLDIWVLVLVHGVAGLRKQALSVLKNKLSTCVLTERLLALSVRGQHEVIMPMFSSYLALAETLMQSPDHRLSQAGTVIYSCLFGEFRDRSCRQEVMGNIISHIGSGVASEMNQCLTLLHELVAKDTAAVQPFAIFVKGILDYLDGLSDHQIRLVYAIFSMLVARGSNSSRGVDAMDEDDSTVSSSSGNTDAELNIIIRKQLSHPDVRFQRMGIMGAVALITELARNSTAIVIPRANGRLSPVTLPGPDGSNQTMSKHVSDKVFSLLSNLVTSCQKKPEALSFLYDELSNAIERRLVNTAVTDWCSEHITTGFDENLSDLNNEAKLENKKILALDPFDGDVRFGLDGIENKVALNVITMLSGPTPQQAACVCSHLRLLAACELVMNGSLEGIDALVGCALVLPEKAMLNAFHRVSRSQQDLLCSTLVYCIDWIRELLNAFSSQSGLDIRGKLCHRIKDCLELEGQLEAFLKELSLRHFIPRGLRPAGVDMMVSAVTAPASKVKPASAAVVTGAAAVKPSQSAEPAAAGAAGGRAAKRKNASAAVKPVAKRKKNSANKPSASSKRKRKAAGSGSDGGGDTTEDDAADEDKGSDDSDDDQQEAKTKSKDKKAPKARVVKVKEEDAMKEVRTGLRELKITVHSLLTLDLDLTTRSDADSLSLVPKLEPECLLFLLGDLHTKLVFLAAGDPASKPPPFAKSKPAANASSGSSLLHSYSMPSLVEELKRLRVFTSLHKHLLAASTHLNRVFGSPSSKRQKRGGSDDADAAASQGSQEQDQPAVDLSDLRTDEATNKLVVEIAEKVFRCVQQLLDSPVLKQHPDLVAAVLFDLCGCVDERSASESALRVSRACEQALKFFEILLAAVPSFPTAIVLLRLMEVTVKYAELEQPVRSRLSQAAEGLLCKEWPVSEKLKADNVWVAVRVHTQYAPDPVAVVQQMANEVLPSVLPKDDEAADELKEFAYSATLSVKTLHLYFTPLLAQLVKSFSALVTTDMEVGDAFTVLQQYAKAFASMTKLSKGIAEDKFVMAATLKYGRTFIESFLKRMTFVQDNFVEFKDEAVELFVSIQVGTRQMQIICAHGKTTKDSAITNAAPFAKKAMESFIYQVKAMLKANNMLASFWQGNLKHRAIDGSEVVDEDSEDSQSETEEQA